MFTINNEPMASDSITGPFLKCSYNCGKFYLRRFNLEKHESQHAGIKPFKCENCSESFLSVNEKKQHLRKFHSNREIFKCECGKEFEYDSLLEIHQRKNERPFKCKICEKSFSEKGNLNVHLRKHNKEHPFKCQVENCNSEFTCQGNLTAHLQLHLKIKPFQCEHCKKKFRRKDHLQYHLKTHRKKLQYCNICVKYFENKLNFQSHNLHKHPFNENTNLINLRNDTINFDTDSFAFNIDDTREGITNFNILNLNHHIENNPDTFKFEFDEDATLTEVDPNNF